MSWADRLWMSIRHIRGRLVESILVISATAIGVALVAAMFAFIRSYDRQTDYLLSHPAYREITVEVVGNETEITEAAVRFDASVSRAISLGTADLARARASVAAVDHGYLADAERFVVGSPLTAANRTAIASQWGAIGGTGGIAGGGATGARGQGSGAADGQARADGEFGFTVPRGTEGGTGTATMDPEQMRAQFEALLGTGDDDAAVVSELPVDGFSGYRVTGEFFAAYGLRAAEGTVFTNEDIEAGNQAIVLGHDLARTLFPNSTAIGSRIRLGIQTFTVVGVLAPTGVRSIETGTSFNRLGFVPNAAAQVQFAGRAISFQRPTRTLRFAIDDSSRLDAAVQQLILFFDSEYGPGTTRVTASLNALTSERQKLSRILAVVLFLAAAALFIASINLFNLMLMRVIKRTRGIGISRAIGASRREIFRQFINESACMSLTGAAIGLLLAPIAYGLLRTSLIADVGAVDLMNWLYFVIGAALALAVSVLFGVYPARQAGRVDASLAIRSE
ncbi:MAG: FtsX-like permease family protein [Spirochaetaceae bacterium]|nr:MAG: FtsX-like permease family protein [Spirochaetaceae bacterium]